MGKEREQQQQLLNENIDSDWGCNTKNQRVTLLQLLLVSEAGNTIHVTEETVIGSPHGVDMNGAASGRPSFARCQGRVQVQPQPSGRTARKDSLGSWEITTVTGKRSIFTGAPEKGGRLRSSRLETRLVKLIMYPKHMWFKNQT